MSMHNRSLQNYTDILQDRYGSSDFLFMSRKWLPLVANNHRYKINPTKIKQAVFASLRVQHIIEEVSEERRVSKEVLYKEVHSILNEIGYNRDIAIIRWLGLILIKILKKICTGLYVNEDSIIKIKSLMGTHPVIFAPSHRSYADFILMSYLCYHFDMEIPVIAAGMDFHSMCLMGHILRDCCAFFMRRSFGNDKLYWEIFQEYVNKLVTDGDTAIEFFIEGTRSRTAKSLPPKCGFLSMALEPFFMGRVPDITIVPINISYDRTLEETLFAYELLGIPKPKESTSGLIKALNMLDEKYGRVYVEFGEAISVKQFIGARDGRWERSLDGQPQSNLSDYETTLCVDLAYHVIRQQQCLAVLTPFNLIAIFLSNNQFQPRRSYNVSQIAKEILWFKSVMETLGALVDFYGESNVENVVNEALAVHKLLVTRNSAGMLELAIRHTNLFRSKLNTTELRGHTLSDRTMKVAIPVLMLQHYVNPCLHYIIHPALISVALYSLDASGEIMKDELFRKYHFLRMLLSHEFVLFGEWEEKEFEDALKYLDLLNIIEMVTPTRFALGNHRKLQVLFCHLLQPFLSGYLVLCAVVRQDATSPLSEREILKITQRRVESLFDLKILFHASALSLDMYASGLQALLSLQAIKKVNINDEVKYTAEEPKLQEVTSELENLVSKCKEKCDIELKMYKEEVEELRIRAKL